jgi:hypothetical protein
VVPENLRYGGGVANTVFNPVVALVLVLAGVLMLVLPQRKVIIPFLLTAILIPSDQVLVVAGLHFSLMRLLIVFGFLRMFVIKGRGDWTIFSGGMNKIDKAVIGLTITRAVAGILLFRTTQAAIFQSGEIFNAFGVYFLLRCLIRDREDVVRAMRTFVVVVLVLAAVMTFETAAGGRNPYALLGGANAAYFANSIERDGHVRATGSFGTPIMAGVFGIVLVPIFFGLWKSDAKQKTIAILGMAAGVVMGIASHSSTPAAGLVIAILGLALWQVRGMMRAIRWGLVLVLLALQMVMKAPVYALISRFDFSGSSWHREALIDQTLKHFGDWWLVGTANNANWGWDMWDTSNQYVAHAIDGGLLGLIFFVAIIVYGFKYVGTAAKVVTDKKQAFFTWSLGAALFVFAMSFLGISLWDQSIVEWYALLAIICAVAVPQAQGATELLKETCAMDSESRSVEPVFATWRNRRVAER